MDQNTSLEANSCSPRQDTPRILWKLKVITCLKEPSHPPLPILSQINPLHTHTIPLRSILIHYPPIYT
jgi:hypothetical protein